MDDYIYIRRRDVHWTSEIRLATVEDIALALEMAAFRSAMVVPCLGPRETSFRLFLVATLVTALRVSTLASIALVRAAAAAAISALT